MEFGNYAHKYAMAIYMPASTILHMGIWWIDISIASLFVLCPFTHVECISITVNLTLFLSGNMPSYSY